MDKLSLPVAPHHASYHASATPEAANALADTLEAELLHLRERRPHLAAKITRAAHILVAHLSSPGQVIRVRVGKGKPRFLVRSLNADGAVYIVYSGDWSCSCPDYHRSYERGATCKHVLACYVLWRASLAQTAGYRVAAKLEAI